MTVLGTKSTDSATSLAVLQFCYNVFYGDHRDPVRLAFESEFFQVLINFVKARKGHGARGLPHEDICLPIGQIVYSATLFLANSHFDNSWSMERFSRSLKRVVSSNRSFEASQLRSRWNLRRGFIQVIQVASMRFSQNSAALVQGFWPGNSRAGMIVVTYIRPFLTAEIETKTHILKSSID